MSPEQHCVVDEHAPAVFTHVGVTHACVEVLQVYPLQQSPSALQPMLFVGVPHDSQAA
jgi:hypothetical protein